MGSVAGRLVDGVPSHAPHPDAHREKTASPSSDLRWNRVLNTDPSPSPPVPEQPRSPALGPRLGSQVWGRQVLLFWMPKMRQASSKPQIVLPTEPTLLDTRYRFF